MAKFQIFSPSRIVEVQEPIVTDATYISLDERVDALEEVSHPPGDSGGGGGNGDEVFSFGGSFGNGSSYLTTGQKGTVRVRGSGHISSISMLSSTSGTVEVDIKKCSYANYPNFVSITGVGGIYMENSSKYDNSTLTGFDVEVNDGDIFSFVINSCNGIKYLQVTSKVQNFY